MLPSKKFPTLPEEPEDELEYADEWEAWVEDFYEPPEEEAWFDDPAADYIYDPLSKTGFE